MRSAPLLDGLGAAEVSAGVETAANGSGPEDAAGAGPGKETVSRNVAVGMKNRLPVTAVLKSRMRS